MIHVSDTKEIVCTDTEVTMSHRDLPMLIDFNSLKWRLVGIDMHAMLHVKPSTDEDAIRLKEVWTSVLHDHYDIRYDDLSDMSGECDSDGSAVWDLSPRHIQSVGTTSATACHQGAVRSMGA